MPSIFDKAIHYFQQNLPFVLYCKPSSADLIGFFQQNSDLHQAINFAEKGFVFSDFRGTQSVLFPENKCEILQEKCVFDAYQSGLNFSAISIDGKESFEKTVRKGIEAIENNEFEKVVLSRKETVTQIDFKFLEVFQKMLTAYPTAFCYCWFHPEIGMWMGATPEQLLKVENATFKTVALAGTQKWQEESAITWEKKEKEEQQFVTDFIVSSLESEVDLITKSEAYSFQAGKVVHLKTDIEGVFKLNFDLKKVLSVLHPTPAVCGLPKEKANAFIIANEGYDRKFYAGFLGELNFNSTTKQSNHSDLFVNLRCMEIQKNEVQLYIGCGITKDSNPEKEYFETANKAMTMKQILN
jgi:isochorismate synthase